MEKTTTLNLKGNPMDKERAKKVIQDLVYECQFRWLYN